MGTRDVGYKQRMVIHPRRLLFICLLLLITACSPAVLAPAVPEMGSDELEIHLIYVGQGDAILIKSPEGKTALIDSGNPGAGALEYLKSLGITRLDLAVVTHAHGDHVGDMADIIAAIPPELVVTNKRSSDNPQWTRLLDIVEERGINRRKVSRGDILELGSLQFEVLNPPVKGGGAQQKINNRSVVLKLEYGQTTVLLVGDAEIEAEQEMMAAGIDLKADILKLGHHGASTSSHPAFLDAVAPDVAVYSAGVNNELGFPEAVTLENLVDREIAVYGTDIFGTILIAVDEAGYEITDIKGVPLPDQPVRP